MAIAYDATSNKYVDGTSGSLVQAHTCSGSDRILFVATTVYDASPAIVTGVTYNGVAMTQVGGITQSTNYRVELFYLIAPATGSNNISVQYSGGAPTRKGLAGVSYTGAKQSAQPDSSNTTGSASTTSLTTSTTVVGSNSWLVVGVIPHQLNAAAGAGTLVRSSPSPAATVCPWIFDSNGTVGTGSQSLVITQSPANPMGTVIASFTPSAGGASGPANLKSLNTNLTANIKSYNGNLIANIKSINTNV